MAKKTITQSVYAALSHRYDDAAIAKKYGITKKTLQNKKSQWGEVSPVVHEHIAGILMAVPLEDTADILEAAAAIDLMITARHRDRLLERMIEQSQHWKPIQQLELLAILSGQK